MPLKPKKYSIRYLTSSQGYVRGGGLCPDTLSSTLSHWHFDCVARVSCN